MVGADDVTKLTLLDLGAGDESLGSGIEVWARRYGREWRVTKLDLSLAALQLGAAPFIADRAKFLSDGLQSIRRGWRVGEWRDLAKRADMLTHGCGSTTARAYCCRRAKGRGIAFPKLEAVLVCAT